MLHKNVQHFLRLVKFRIEKKYFSLVFITATKNQFYKIVILTDNIIGFIHLDLGYSFIIKYELRPQKPKTVLASPMFRLHSGAFSSTTPLVSSFSQ